MKIIKPYLDRFMGTELSLLKKITIKAGLLRLAFDSTDRLMNEDEFIVTAITEEIINKEEEIKS